MAEYWRMSAIGGVLSGTLGIHGHFANGLSALYLAAGVTRFEVTGNGGLYATVTLPGIMVGTGLPTQKACLELMGLQGSAKAKCRENGMRNSNHETHEISRKEDGLRTDTLRHC